MKSLPNVTLISYDNSDDPTRTLRALQHCASLMEFDETILVCRVLPSEVNGETVFRVREKDYASAMVFEVLTLHSYVRTDYALCIHYDGYIINPDKWNDAWLQYDFIGAPWPISLIGSTKSRVGNTGFCLKSKAFMINSYEIGALFRNPKSSRDDPNGLPGDTFCCRTMRSEMERRGMKFAPVEVAADFSWECNIEEFPQGRPDAFGFHNFSGKNVPRI